MKETYVTSDLTEKHWKLALCKINKNSDLFTDLKINNLTPMTYSSYEKVKADCDLFNKHAYGRDIVYIIIEVDLNKEDLYEI